MINGHGDDAYLYTGITSDFSSNICAPTSHQALMSHLANRSDLLSHYPEPEAWSLEAMISDRLGIDPACIIVTNGATEAIYLIAQTFPYRPTIPAPTFREYEDACASFRNDEERTALWLCNPNNPDGHVLSPAELQTLIAAHSLVILDLSYAHYTAATTTPTMPVAKLPNVIQVHSFTKTYAVPGLRLGYIVAHEGLTAQLRQNLRPWSVSALAIEAGKFLLQHPELICHPDLAEAQRLRRDLLAIGLDVLPTQTNFMLCRLPEVTTAAALKDYLAREHHILIRDASNFRGLTPQHFRVAAQTPKENDALVRAIQQFICQ